MRRAGAFGRRRGVPVSCRALCAGLLALALAFAPPQRAFAASSTQPSASDGADVVVVLLTPFLTWQDLSPSATPNLWALATDGAIGNMNAVTADDRWPTAAGGALTLSAGSWARAGAEGLLPAPEPFSALRAENARLLARADIGALGSALRSAGLVTAAIGCNDFGDSADASGSASALWPIAVLAAADAEGAVDFARTAPDLLAENDSAAFGVLADAAAVGQAAEQALAFIAESDAGKGLLVVEPGDLVRAHYAEEGGPGGYHRLAVENADAIAGGLRQALLGKQAVLLVVSPATDKPYYQAPFFGPTIAYGSGLHGFLTSASTHRAGLVTNRDFAPTVLSALGVTAPDAMVGSPFASGGAAAVAAGSPSATEEHVAALIGIGEGTGSVDFLRDRIFIPAFCLLGVALALFAAVAGASPKPSRRVRKAASVAILFALSIPPAAWVMFAFSRYPATVVLAAAAFVLTTLGIFALALGLARLRRGTPELPPLFLSTLTTVVICADQWLGHPIESGLFSYSIRAGWRYYGMGNEGAALVVAASIVAVGLLGDLADKSGRGKLVRLWVLPVVAVIVLVSAAAPFAGANAGVAVWGTVAYAASWLAINRIRISWKSLALIAGAVVVLVGAFVAIDLALGDGQTHLGRFFSAIASGGLPSAWELIRRKLVNAVNYVPRTPYTALAVAMAAALAFSRWRRPARPLERALAGRPRFSGALLGIVVGSALALVTEDSGIVMPALMLFVATLSALYLTLEPAEA